MAALTIRNKSARLAKRPDIRVTIIPSRKSPDLQEERIVNTIKWLLDQERQQSEAA